MSTRRIFWLSFAAVATCVVMCSLAVLSWWGVGQAVGRLNATTDFIQADMEAREVTVYTTTWNSAAGEQTVRTTRQDGETAQEHAQRHASDVAALQEIFPPID